MKFNISFLFRIRSFALSKCKAYCHNTCVNLEVNTDNLRITLIGSFRV